MITIGITIIVSLLLIVFALALFSAYQIRKAEKEYQDKLKNLKP
jgi:hypothetical protein